MSGEVWQRDEVEGLAEAIHEGPCSQASRLNGILSLEPSEYRNAVDYLWRKGSGKKEWGKCKQGHAVKTSKT